MDFKMFSNKIMNMFRLYSILNQVSPFLPGGNNRCLCGYQYWNHHGTRLPWPMWTWHKCHIRGYCLAWNGIRWGTIPNLNNHEAESKILYILQSHTRVHSRHRYFRMQLDITVVYIHSANSVAHIILYANIISYLYPS